MNATLAPGLCTLPDVSALLPRIQDIPRHVLRMYGIVVDGEDVAVTATASVSSPVTSPSAESSDDEDNSALVIDEERPMTPKSVPAAPSPPFPVLTIHVVPAPASQPNQDKVTNSLMRNSSVQNSFIVTKQSLPAAEVASTKCTISPRDCRTFSNTANTVQEFPSAKSFLTFPPSTGSLTVSRVKSEKVLNEHSKLSTTVVQSKYVRTKTYLPPLPALTKIANCPPPPSLVRKPECVFIKTSPDSSPVSSVKEETVNFCALCKKLVADISIEDHLQKHCVQQGCKDLILDAVDRARHIKMHDHPTKPFLCRYCKKRYRFYGNVIKHHKMCKAIRRSKELVARTPPSTGWRVLPAIPKHMQRF